MTIVYVDMVADLFHRGHVNFLKRVSNMGDKLYVGLLSAKDASSYKRIPIMSIGDRSSVIEACKYVDKVIINCPLVITEDFIKEHKIDMVVHAHDKTDTKYDFMYTIPLSLGIFKRIDYTCDISTTDIINKIQSRVTF